MPSYPTGPETGAIYTLTNSAGYSAVFNSDDSTTTGQLKYNYSTTTTAGAASGTFRLNNATHSSATSMYLSETDASSVDRSAALTAATATVGTGTTVTIRSYKNPALVYRTYTITAASDSGTYRTFTVTYLTGAGTLDADERCFVTVAIAGNYVGALAGDDAVTGLDSPEVRESFSDISEGDGAIHGNFYHGRRPITLSGQIVADSTEARNERLTRLQRATNSLQADGTLTWTPTGGISQFCYVRKQQPTRIAGAGTIKNFFVALVAADPRIYATTATSYSGIAIGGTQVAENRGSYAAPFDSITISRPTGSTVNTITVTVGGVTVVKLGGTGTGGTPAALGWTSASAITNYVINTRTRSVVTTGSVTDAYNTVDFTASNWTDLSPGNNNVSFSVTGGGTGSTMAISYRDVWM